MIVPLEVIEHLTSSVLAPDFRFVFDYLNDKINISEFDIAEELGCTVNETRAILYHLSNLNLVSSRKKKDPKKGWYVHYWSLNPSEIVYFYRKQLLKQVEDLKEKIRFEKNNLFFRCPDCMTRIHIDDALGMSYQCPECGTYLEPLDNSKLIQRLENKLGALKHKMISSVAVKPLVRVSLKK